MSIGAINQLIINNERPDIFTDNPSITFFKPNYRKYVNFAKTEQQYQLPNISFGSSVEFNLPKTDYINNIILSVLLPEISGKFKRWTKRQVKKKLEEYGELNDADVIAKKERAVKYCKVATNYNQANNGKPWKYVFIPSSTLNAAITVEMLFRTYVVEE